MKKLFRILPVTLLILLITSCDLGKLIAEYYFTEEMYEQIPFEGNETLIFIDDDGNNIVLIGGDRINEIHKVDECITCSDYYYFETGGIKFSNDTYILTLSMEASTEYKFLIGLNIEGTSFTYTYYDNLPLSKEYLQGDEVFYDSINVNNSTYYNVFGDTLINGGTIPIGIYPVFCYYSTEYGVIKIDFSDDSYWELEDIEW